VEISAIAEEKGGEGQFLRDAAPAQARRTCSLSSPGMRLSSHGVAPSCCHTPPLRLSLSLGLSDKLPSLVPKAQEPDAPGELFDGNAPSISSRFCAPGECCPA
jgi:hypothetical protein